MEVLDQAWHIITTIVSNILHPDKWQEVLKQKELYHAALIAVTLIVFTETGLLVGFFLPGDSLLVTVGLAANLGDWPVWWMIPVFWTAAVLGDSSGYAIGRSFGPRIFQKEKSWFFRKKYLLMAKAYYELHGGKTIILAKFVPIIRTFAPVVAGAGHMPYRRFVAFSIFGAGSWISSMLLIGYCLPIFIDPVLQKVFGPEFKVEKHIEKVIILVIAISVFPIFWKGLKGYLAHRRKPAEGPSASSSTGTMTGTGAEPNPNPSVITDDAAVNR